MDALADQMTIPLPLRERQTGSVESRLRLQMQADALQPLFSTLEDDSHATGKSPMLDQEHSSETVEESVQFLRLNVRHCPVVPMIIAE